MGYSYTPKSYGHKNYDKSYELKIEVDKEFNTKIDTEVKAEYELKVDVYKDIDVKLDIYTDVDLEGNSAVTTGLAENDSSKYLLDTTTLAYTDDYNSKVNSTAGVIKDLTSPIALGDYTTQAYGHDTYAELDMQVHVTDYSSVISWTGESATD